LHSYRKCNETLCSLGIIETCTKSRVKRQVHRYNKRSLVCKSTIQIWLTTHILYWW